MTFRTPPDYEQPADSDRNNIYEVEVRPYDGRYYGSHFVTVTVTPVNEPPTITTTSTSATTMRHPENRTSRLYTYRATDPEQGTIAWSLAGDHASFFAIDEQRGELFFSESSPPDFEDARGSGTDGQEYQVTVQASDGSLSGTLAVTVTVTDVNEGPEVRRSGSLFGSPAGSVPENQAQDTALARYTATDPEDNAATITLWSTSGRDGGDFVINEQGELRFRSAPDYERPADSDRNNIYEVTIRASDGRYTGTLEETQVITVAPVNEAPEITTTSALRPLRCVTLRTGPPASTLTGPPTRSEARSPGRWRGTHASFFSHRRTAWRTVLQRDRFRRTMRIPKVRAINRQEYQVTVHASDGTLAGTRSP